jgi:hypothetical protein
MLVSYAVTPAVQSRDGQALANALLIVFAICMVARYLCRPKPIYATEASLEIGSGRGRRLIPWSRVVDVREMGRALSARRDEACDNRRGNVRFE